MTDETGPEDGEDDVLLSGRRADGLYLELTRETLRVGPAEYAVAELRPLEVKRVEKVSPRGLATMVIATLILLPALVFQFLLLLAVGIAVLIVALTKFGKVEAFQLVGEVDGAPAVILEMGDEASIWQVKEAVEEVGV